MKTALLTFIHKAGDSLQYSNYRGISLLSWPVQTHHRDPQRTVVKDIARNNGFRL
jgi:hypothetical protein